MAPSSNLMYCTKLCTCIKYSLHRGLYEPPSTTVPPWRTTATKLMVNPEEEKEDGMREGGGGKEGES